jgi:hypothetical protein
MSGLGALGPISSVFSPEKLYIFGFDALDPKVNLQSLAQYMTDSRTIRSWSYLTVGLYLIRSTHSAMDLSEALRRVVGNARCIVIQADDRNVGGWLPPQAWDWLSRKEPAAINALTMAPRTLKDE